MSGEEARRRGRPRLPDEQAKRASFATRISSEVRRALEIEAERTDRSMSQVAEEWLSQAARGQVDWVSRTGGVHTAAVLERMAVAAREVVNQVGDPAADEHARAALLAAWRVIMPGALPPSPPSAARRALLNAAEEVHRAAATWLKSYGDLPPDHPLRIALSRIRSADAWTRYIPGYVEESRSPVEVLEAVADGRLAIQHPERLSEFGRACDRISSALEERFDALSAAETSALPTQDEAVSSTYTNLVNKVGDFYKAQIAILQDSKHAIEAGRRIAREMLLQPDEFGEDAS